MVYRTDPHGTFTHRFRGRDDTLRRVDTRPIGQAPAAPHLPEHPAELTVSAETSTSPRAERAPAEDAEDAARVRADLADAQQLLKQRESGASSGRV